MVGKGVVEVFIKMGVLALGASFHALEIFTLYFAGVGLMGYVSICVLIVFCRTCCSSCGVCKFGVRFVWLCTHIIDVREGSMRL